MFPSVRRTNVHLVRPVSGLRARSDDGAAIRAFVRRAPGEQRWSDLAYEAVYRHLMDMPVDQPGVDIGPVRLTEIQGIIEFAAKVAGRAPHHLQDATFRAVLGHLLYRLGRDGFGPEGGTQ